MIEIHPTVLVIICGILITSIGFFAGGYINNSNKAQQKLMETVNRLDNTITRLDTTIGGIEKANDRFEDACKERHSVVDKRLRSIELSK